MAPAIRVEGLTKRFGDRTAFEDLTFDVAPGEVFGFLGPNGAGKTTTVRVLGTLVRATAGTAEVAGVRVDRAHGPELRSRISIMTETPGAYLKLSVRENLTYFARLHALPPAEVPLRIDRALDAVDLGARRDDLAGSLSKGLRQRLALARALLTDPQVMFLDEPTTGLDPAASREVRDLIGGLRERGVTVFLTTHRLEEAERLCDRIAILNTRLRAIGPPSELRRRLFATTVEVRLAAPLLDPDRTLGIDGVERWQHADGRYLVQVHDPAVAAELARAVVAAGADLLHLAEVEHSLEDVYLQLLREEPAP